MASARSPQACCCLPARTGVLVFSVLTFFGGGLVVAVQAWRALSLTVDSDTRSKVALISSGLSWTIVVIVSALGFVGTSMRKPILVAVYAIILFCHFWIAVGISAFSIAMLFIDDPYQQCVVSFRAKQNGSFCQVEVNIAYMIGFIVVPLLLIVQCYSSIIAWRYAAQLKEEQLQDARDPASVQQATASNI